MKRQTSSSAWHTCWLFTFAMIAEDIQIEVIANKIKMDNGLPIWKKTKRKRFVFFFSETFQKS